MKKFKIVALLAALTFMFSGCSLVSVNEERVANQVIASVNGVNIYRYEIDYDAIDSTVDQYVAYGYLEDTTAAKSAFRKDMMDKSLDALVKEELFVQKADELGIALTDEEMEDNRTTADKHFSDEKDTLRTEVEQEYGVSEDSATATADATPTATASAAATAPSQADIDAEVERRYQEYVDQLGFTPDTYYDYLNRQSLVSKVTDYIYGLAEVTDDDAKQWYDEMLPQQQEAMDNDVSAFEQCIDDGQIFTYVPEDSVAVKQVLLAFEDQDLVQEAKTLEADGKEDLATALMKPFADELMPTAEQVAQQLKDGANIDDLIAQYGGDTKMTEDPYDQYGYIIGSQTTAYDAKLMEEALALTNVDDVGGPYVASDGIHVLQCIQVYKQGVVPYEDLVDAIKEGLLPSKKDTKLTEVTQEWLDAANVVYYRDRMYS